MSLVDISDSVLRLVPESIARENLIIAIDSAPGSMTVAYSDSLGAEIDDIHERLENVYGRTVKCVCYPEAEIRTALDRHFPPEATVGNCGWKFKFQCPQRWEDLVKGENASVRFCHVCSKNVHLCTGDQDAINHAKLGHCIAKLDQRDEGLSGLLGELMPDFSSEA